MVCLNGVSLLVLGGFGCLILLRVFWAGCLGCLFCVLLWLWVLIVCCGGACLIVLFFFFFFMRFDAQFGVYSHVYAL